MDHRNMHQNRVQDTTQEQWHLPRSWGRGSRVLGLIELFGLLGLGCATTGQGQGLLWQSHQPAHEGAETLQAPGPSVRATLQAAYGHLPLSFEANQGQTDGQAKFLSRGHGYTLFLTSTEAMLVLSMPPGGDASADARIVGKPAPLPTKDRLLRNPTSNSAPAPATVLRMQMVGSNAHPQVVGLEELPGKTNYFLSNDPQQWRTNVSTYAKVHYTAVYPGVDLVYYGHQGQLEYDFRVAPGADPHVITLRFEGTDRVDVDAEGDLMLSTAGGSLRFQKPLVYQEVDGHRQVLAGGYVPTGPQQVGFSVVTYDPAHPLIIDPVFLYATFLGGIGDSTGFGIAVDAAGNAYVTGSVSGFNSPDDFPTTPGAFHTSVIDVNTAVFVTKLNATGSALIYSAYFGGHTGSRSSGGVVDNISSSIAVDAAGNAYVTGQTTAVDFPMTPGVHQPTLGDDYGAAFVTKLNTAGSGLIYSTYLSSGNGVGPSSAFSGIAVDAAGNAYMTGAGRRTLGGNYDAFVAKLTPDGSALVYGTLLGGSAFDIGIGIAVDAAGNAYVTGQSGVDFPVTPGALQPMYGGNFDAFVAKLNSAGSALIYSIYLGGSEDDRGFGIAMDAAGNAYVTGSTRSADFHVTKGAFQPKLASISFGNAFVVKFAAGCGDERDNLIQQYKDFNVVDSTSGAPFVPTCHDFTQTADNNSFSFAEFNVNNTFSWALIRTPLLLGVDLWIATYGSPRHINSAYRNPQHNNAVGGAPRSRHMFGDATDLRNETGSQQEWNAMHQAAQTIQADWIENINGPCQLNCVHADWRVTAGPYAP